MIYGAEVTYWPQPSVITPELSRCCHSRKLEYSGILETLKQTFRNTFMYIYFRSRFCCHIKCIQYVLAKQQHRSTYVPPPPKLGFKAFECYTDIISYKAK
jgi:hypothetical protein